MEKKGASNNSTVINKRRTQGILYLNKYALSDEMIEFSGPKINFKINDWFEHNTKILSPVLEPIIDRFITQYCGIKNENYRIQRIMHMVIPPGEPEQQVHQDGDLGDGAWFVFMPLNTWTREMGGTIYYYDYMVGHIREIGMDSSGKRGYVQTPNKGFLKGNKYKSLYDSARFYRPLKLGDLSAHTETTLHHGAENKRNKTRRGIFIVLQMDLNKNEATKIEWIDELDLMPPNLPDKFVSHPPGHRIPVIRNSFKARIPRDPEADYGNSGMDPYQMDKMINDDDPEIFKA